MSQEVVMVVTVEDRSARPHIGDKIAKHSSNPPEQLASDIHPRSPARLSQLRRRSRIDSKRSDNRSGVPVMASPSVFPGEFGDELLLHIFADVAPEDNLGSLQLVCKKFYTVANDQTIWRRNCITSFRYWQDEHWFQDNVGREQADADWKEVWLLRKRTNSHISRLLNGIIETKVGRLESFAGICEYGYDAKDFLLEQLETPDDAEDVLARRWALHFLCALSGRLPRLVCAWLTSTAPIPWSRAELLCQVLRNDGSRQPTSRHGG